MDPAPLPPPTLSYDDLSPGSDIRREFAEGIVRITIPPGEASPQALRQARHDAVLDAAYLSIVFLLTGAAALIIALRARPLSDVEVAVVWLAFAVLCLAAILLIAAARYTTARDALRASRRQSTIIAATTTRILIESAGPFGSVSHDIPAAQIHHLTLATTRWHDEHRRPYQLRHARIVLKDANAIIDFAPGRDRDELRFIVRAIGSVTGRNVVVK